MSQRKPYLLRLPAGLMDELNRWAKDELRSLNAQIEYVLRDALRRQRREPPSDVESEPTGSDEATEA